MGFSPDASILNRTLRQNKMFFNHEDDVSSDDDDDVINFKFKDDPVASLRDRLRAAPLPQALTSSTFGSRPVSFPPALSSRATSSWLTGSHPFRKRKLFDRLPQQMRTATQASVTSAEERE